MTAPLSFYTSIKGRKAVGRTEKQIIPEQAPPDQLASHIEGSLRGMARLRDEAEHLRGRVSQLERDNLMLDSEVKSLTIQLEAERCERRHYHSLANEIITRLDIVGRAVDDVVQRAQHEVYSKRKEQPRAELPELQIPAFLKQPIPEIPSTNGTEQ